MDSERWQRIKTIHREAQELEGEARAAFVAERCAGDEALAQEIMSLMETPTRDDSALNDIVGEAATLSAPSSGKRVGPYRIVRSLGEGGMGAVYLAERADQQFEQQVAIKMVSWVHASDSLNERFRVERQILAGLDHPNIARLLDGGTTDEGVPYLVMEYIDGQSMRDHAASHGIRQQLELFLKICDAVQYAHSQLVVHRDIKPSNVMVTTSGVPKLLDFGIAKLLDHETNTDVTRPEARLMTPEYASPEQLQGMPVTIATDVYGLGLLLYQLLTGRLPFDTRTATSLELREMICNTEPQPPSAMLSETGAGIASRLRGDLDNIVLMALRKEPERRYETVRALASDIRRHLDKRPVLARAPSAAYRISRFVSRNRVGVTAATAALAAVLAVTGFYTARLQVERDVAQTERQTAEAATEFMIDLFSVSDPHQGAARDITAREVLDAGAEKLDAGLEDTPRVRARLMQTLGRVYERLGDYDKAQRFLEEGVGLQRTVVDPLNEGLIEGIEQLAWIYYRREDWALAQKTAEEALAKREARVGPNDPSLSEVLNHLGTIAYWQDDMQGAIAHYQRALSVLDGDDEEIVKDRMVTMNNLAITYDYMGLDDEAEQFYRQSLDTRIVVYGPDHPRVGTAHANLGTLYANRQRWELAREHGLRALAIDRATLGDIHADVAFDLGLLSGAERGLGNYEASAEYAEQAAEIWGATVGKQHTRYASALDTLATTWRLAGEFDKALEPAEEALEVMLAANGPEHTYSAKAFFTKAQILSGLERFDEALEFARQASAVREKVLGRQSPEYWNAQLGMARILLRDNQPAAAEATLTQLIEDIDGAAASGERQLATARELLARATGE